jgi:hypothetical protein
MLNYATSGKHLREVSRVMPLFDMTPYITQQLFRVL